MNEKKLQRKIAAANAASERMLRQVYSLSAAFLRSEAVQEAFDREMALLVAGGVPDTVLLEEAVRNLKLIELSAYLRVESLLSLHMATLYAVVEKWEKWQFTDPAVDSLIEHPNIKKLRNYRHAIFHADLHDAKGIMELSADREIIPWLRQLSDALRVALLKWHSNTEACLTEFLVRKGYA